jgi:hypothetical protein
MWIKLCELISAPALSIQDDLLKSFHRHQIKETSLLGAPLFEGPTLDQAWSDRIIDLTRACERLKQIGAQDALILLRASFGIPRVQYLLRCSPSAYHPSLLTFDDLLRSAIEVITNSKLTKNQWLQASAPIREGGLGVRRVAALALPAYLASAASTLPLQKAILSNCMSQQSLFFESYLASWTSRHGPLEPDMPFPAKQAFWDKPGIAEARLLVEANLENDYQKTCFLAASAPHSGDWLLALPIVQCGLRLDDEAVRIGVALRLGLEVCVPRKCRCDAQVDAYGTHGLACKHSAGRIARHQSLNDIIARAFSASGTPMSKEPNGLHRADGKRPDGLTLVPWSQGKPLTWDVTCICSTAASYIGASAHEAGSAAELTATRKK